jgi:ATP-dependent Lon protease
LFNYTLGVTQFNQVQGKKSASGSEKSSLNCVTPNTYRILGHGDPFHLYVDTTVSESFDDEPGLEHEIAIEPPDALHEKHLTFQENMRGITFDALFGSYLKGALRITITDPYIRLFFQARNLMELLETIARFKSEDEVVAVHLVTAEDIHGSDKQREYLEKIEQSSTAVCIDFTWEFDKDNTIHARHIVTDHGWKLSLIVV